LLCDCGGVVAAAEGEGGEEVTCVIPTLMISHPRLSLFGLERGRFVEQISVELYFISPLPPLFRRGRKKKAPLLHSHSARLTLDDDKFTPTKHLTPPLPTTAAAGPQRLTPKPLPKKACVSSPRYFTSFAPVRSPARQARAAAPTGQNGLMEHTIDPKTFWDRLSKLHKTWNVRQAHS